MGPTSSLVGPIDLDDDHICGAETAGKGGTVGLGAFNADTIKLTEAPQPRQEGDVAGRGCRKLLIAEMSS